MDNKIVVIIPCLNESRHIHDVVASTKKYVDRVIVVDDRSTDNTTALALEAGAEVIHPDWERGQGGAGRSTMFGIHYAMDTGADIIITLDGDGQHSPDDLPKFITAIKYYDVVCGCRENEGMPKNRIIGNWLLTLATNLGTDKHIKDTQCGYRAFKSYVFRDLDIKTHGFGFCSEVIIKLMANKYEIGQVPVKTIYHQAYSENSTLHPFKHAFLVGMSIIKWRVKS